VMLWCVQSCCHYPVTDWFPV